MPPKVELKYWDRNWNLCWKRLDSGVLSFGARNVLFLLLHEKVGTKERGHRLMPTRYVTSLCPRCEIRVETQTHRYARCDAVMHTWESVKDLIVSLDPVLLSVSNKRLLHLDYPKVRRENAILWLLGVYLEYVECEVIRHDNRVTSVGLIGYLRYRKLASRDLAIPNLGFIQGID